MEGIILVIMLYLDRVARPVSSPPDHVVSPVPRIVVKQDVRSVDVSCHLVRFLDCHSTVIAD